MVTDTSYAAVSSYSRDEDPGDVSATGRKNTIMAMCVPVWDATVLRRRTPSILPALIALNGYRRKNTWNKVYI